MKRLPIILTLICFCVAWFPSNGSVNVEYGGFTRATTTRSLRHLPMRASPTSGHIQVTLNPSDLSGLSGQCFNAPTPQWQINNITLTEKAGITTRLVGMSIEFFDNNLNSTGSEEITGSKLASFFKACGSDGVIIPANGKLCSSFCISLGGTASGAISFGLTLEDNLGLDCVGNFIIYLLPPKGTQGADLSITSAASGFGVAKSGAIFLHTITVTNNGPQTANNVVVTDTLDAKATFQAIALTQGQTATPPVNSSGTVTCSLGTIPPGVSQYIWLFLKAPNVNNGFISTSNVASVTSTTADPYPGNNRAEGFLGIEPRLGTPGHYSVTTTPLTGSAALGTRVTYTIKASASVENGVGVHFAHILPAGTTLASVSVDKGFLLSKPPIGGTGVIFVKFGLAANEIATVTITVNVLNGVGSVLGDISKNLPFDGPEVSANILLPPNCGTIIPLIRPDEPPPSMDFIPSGAISIGGGHIISILWGIGSPSGGDPTPSPHLGGAGALSLTDSADESISLPPSIAAAITPSAEPCALIGYKLYIADNPASVVDPANVWKMLPPDVSSTSVPSAPSGSYYALVAVYRCPDGTTRDSQPSNIVSTTSSGPRITGTPFRQGKHLYVPGTGFVDGAKIIRNDQTLKKTNIETDTLLRAKKEGKTTFAGDRIKVRNPDGSESNTVIYP